MKKMKTNYDFNPGRLNSFILKLNRSSYILIISIYAALLVLVLFFANPAGKLKIDIPNYEHDTFPQEVYTQISLIPSYTYISSREELDVYYYISTRNGGKLNENKQDPAYVMDHFLLGAYLTNNKMYYFNEMFGYQTEITHSYYLSEYDSPAPKAFYTTVFYTDLEGNKIKTTHKEDIMLELKDPASFNHVNTISHFEDDKIVTDVRIRFANTKSSSNHRISTRITLGDYDKIYHIDMQSWLVTSDGSVYPFTGLYGYQDEKGMFTYDNLSFPLIMEAKYLYAELHYYLPGQEVQKIKYRVLIDDLPTSVSQDPIYSDTIVEPTTIPWSTILLISASALIGIGIAGAIYYYQKKKQEKLG